MLGQIKSLLGFTDGTKDELLNQIIGIVESRLKLKLGGLDVVPPALKYIVVEASIIRYNRISSEGASKHSVDGFSTEYLEDDFTPFLDDIQEWLEQNSEDGKAKVKFL